MFGEGELCEPRRYSVLTISVLYIGFVLDICVGFVCRIYPDILHASSDCFYNRYCYKCSSTATILFVY